VDVESFDERSGEVGKSEHAPEQLVQLRRPPGPVEWMKNTNHSPDFVAFLRRTRRALPGDPDFGDPLSTAGEGGPSAAARAADRLLERDVASREISLAALQVWQALRERVSGKPVNREVTLVFTDLVEFSPWSLQAGDDATLLLLRRVAQAIEPPLLEAGGQIVKRMGDGLMAVFSHPATAVRAVIAAREALKGVEVDGYTPRMRAGVHTGRPQRIGSDWLGIDVNVAHRVMERATKGGLVLSQATLDRISPDDFESLGVETKRLRRQAFASRQGVPTDLVMYRVKTRKELPGEEVDDAVAGEG
jgi:adenylate cyclase